MTFNWKAVTNSWVVFTIVYLFATTAVVIILISYRNNKYGSKIVEELISNQSTLVGKTDDPCFYQLPDGPADPSYLRLDIACPGKSVSNSITLKALTKPTLQEMVLMVSKLGRFDIVFAGEKIQAMGKYQNTDESRWFCENNSQEIAINTPLNSGSVVKCSYR